MAKRKHKSVPAPDQPIHIGALDKVTAVVVDPNLSPLQRGLLLASAALRLTPEKAAAAIRVDSAIKAAQASAAPNIFKS